MIMDGIQKNNILEALKEYREESSLNLLISLFEKEQQFYFEKCKYFI